MKRRALALLLSLLLLPVPARALTVEQAREVLQTHYIDEIPEEVLSQPTIDAMLDALGDPYTTYYTAQEYARFLSTMEDTELVGIGIRALYLEQGVLLEQVAPDSPALEGGLRAGDVIVAIDGHDARGAQESDIDAWIHGEEGSAVELRVLRDGSAFEVTLRRREVVFPTVTLEKVENGIAWICCSAFGSTTFRDFYDIITACDGQARGWVVDLRGNGGGDVFAAMFSAGCFAGQGQGAYLRDRSGTYYRYLHSPSLIRTLGYYDGETAAFAPDGTLTHDPVYVLTDAGTASAAEFFCAAIRDSGAGVILGSRTYGKGVAQTLFDSYKDYFQDGEAMKVTTERVFSCAGSTFDKVGILPHFCVDADLADEAAALLTAPAAQGEDALILSYPDASGGSALRAVLPLGALREEAGAAGQLLSRLPARFSCRLRQGGTERAVTVEEAARACGVERTGEDFTDLAGCAYSEEILTLCRYGLLDGDGEGRFRPGDALTRAELCSLLVKALRFPAPEEGAAFADTARDAWYTPAVRAMYAAGMVDGRGGGLFYPEESVTHEEFLTILGRVAQWLSMDCYELSRRDGMYGSQLPDGGALARRYPDYAPWARELVWLCDTCEIWSGPEGLDPSAPATREEAARAVYNLLRATGVLPA